MNMFKVKIDKDVYLIVDFKSQLSPCEEEVTALRFAGKSKQTISKILGKSADTVKKQQNSAYVKLHVDGNDNPLAILQTISFMKGWARFAAVFLMVVSTLPTPRLKAQAKTKAGFQIAFGKKVDDLPLSLCA